MPNVVRLAYLVLAIAINHLVNVFRILWWCTLAWYYEIDDYRDILYAPIPIETTPFRNGTYIVTKYKIFAFPGEIFRLIQTPDANLLPTATEIRELLATRGPDDETCLRVQLAMMDLNHTQTMNVTDIVRSLMGPFNCHLSINKQPESGVQELSHDDLLRLIGNLWLDVPGVMDSRFIGRLDIGIHMQNTTTDRIRQYTTFTFYKHPEILRHFYAPEPGSQPCTPPECSPTYCH